MEYKESGGIFHDHPPGNIMRKFNEYLFGKFMKLTDLREMLFLM